MLDIKWKSLHRRKATQVLYVCVCVQIVYLSPVCTCILGTGSTQWNVLALPVAIKFCGFVESVYEYS